jgi:hypothetical protein
MVLLISDFCVHLPTAMSPRRARCTRVRVGRARIVRALVNSREEREKRRAADFLSAGLPRRLIAVAGNEVRRFREFAAKTLCATLII